MCLDELKKLSIEEIKGVLDGKGQGDFDDDDSDSDGEATGPPVAVKKEESPEPEFGRGFKRVEKK